MKVHLFATTIVAVAALTGVSARAASVTVSATDDIYMVSGTGTAPVAVTLSGATSVSFASVTGTLTSSGGNACGSALGCIVLNNGTGNNPNDPDGIGAGTATSFNSGTSSISGLTMQGAGALVGVFVSAGGPAGAAPTALNFTAGGLGTSFSSLSPVLDQVFFIGDGLTGDGSGTMQVFNAPTGATTLYLGISDAAGYNGGPSSYGDNLGAYNVNFTLAGSGTGSVAPEPAALSLLGAGLLLTVGCKYRRSVSQS